MQLLSGWFVAIGLLLTGIGGSFAPWIWHESVALQLSAPGLAEFVKDLPEVRLGQVEVNRLYFLCPLFLAMIALPVFAHNRRLALPAWVRWSLNLAVIPLALAALSPVWAPPILLSSEFRVQTLLFLLAIGLALISPLFKNLPLTPLVIALLVGSAAAVVLPFWQFGLIQAAVAGTYQEPIDLGWGWWLTLGGIALSNIGAIGAVFIGSD